VGDGPDLLPREVRVMGACGWCRADGLSDRARFCSRRCRQAAFRLRRRSTLATVASAAGVFAYADPPYPGLEQQRAYSIEPKKGANDRLN
jgi:site-specific DNA-adenine methylase